MTKLMTSELGTGPTLLFSDDECARHRAHATVLAILRRVSSAAQGPRYCSGNLTPRELGSTGPTLLFWQTDDE